jgi:hypothetical protein
MPTYDSPPQHPRYITSLMPAIKRTSEKGRVAMNPQRSLRTSETLSVADARKVRHAVQQVKAGKTRPWPQAKHDLGL